MTGHAQLALFPRLPTPVPPRLTGWGGEVIAMRIDQGAPSLETCRSCGERFEAGCLTHDRCKGCAQVELPSVEEASGPPEPCIVCECPTLDTLEGLCEECWEEDQRRREAWEEDERRCWEEDEQPRHRWFDPYWDI